MPLEVLRRVARQPLPQTLRDPHDIDKLRILVAAELVVAELPEPGQEAQGAVLLAITAQGKAALQRDATDIPARQPLA